ncbi:MAG TPA: type II toxin-antitoxin system ParD family antitoxin [Arenibaculum sp.]|nr:type II toxin-antitoxin system ParD family antitoxin [Arenibaculum sp.]
MTVSITPELERFVAGRAMSGRQRGANGVVRTALRLPERYEPAASGRETRLDDQDDAR